jgi:serine phosphatase RsbU (regulator of sigma subunit)
MQTSDTEILSEEITATIDEKNRTAWDLNRKDPKQAIAVAEEALKLSEKYNYLLGQAQALKTIGACNIWLSNNEKALEFSLKAIEVFKEIENKAEEAQCNYNIATNFYYLADYDKALHYFMQCYSTNEKIKNTQGMADGLNGMGTVYYTIEDNKKALESLTRSLELSKSIGETLIRPKVLDGLGNTYKNIGEYEKALEVMFECIALMNEHGGNDQVRAFVLDGIGSIYAKKGDFENSLNYYNQSLEIRRKIGFKVGEATTLSNIGSLYADNKQYDKAIDYLNQSLSLAKEINSKEAVYRASERLSQVFEQNGNLEQAFIYFKEYHQAKEDVRNEKADRRSKSIELQMKIEKAETERKLLKKKNKELENYFNDVVTLSEIGQKITSSLSVEKIIETVYENVNKLMDAPSFGIGVFNKEKYNLEFPGYLEKGKKIEGAVYDLNDTNRFATQCFLNDIEIVINDFETEAPKYISQIKKPIYGESVESLIYMPLHSNKGKVGVITVQSFQKNAYNEYHVNILRNLAVYAAIALENASLYENMEALVKERTEQVIHQKEEIERSYNNTRLLSEIGQQITSTLDFEKIFKSLHENVNKLMDAACFGVRIYHRDKNMVEYKFEFENDTRYESAFVPMDDEDNYTVWCIKNKKEIFLNDNQNEYHKYTKQIKVVSGDMPHSLIFYPMMIGDKVIGVITTQSFKKFAYTQYHLDILKTLASYTAIALENAHLYETLEDKVKERTAEVIRQKEIIEEKNKDITDSIQYAKKIQQAILPAENEIKKVLPNSFVYYSPKDIVSGDFYWYAQAGEWVTFAVADCTGHGVPGALMSAICNNLMNQIINDSNVISPASALNELDDKLRKLLSQSSGGQQGANDGMDIALCRLNVKTNQLIYAGAQRPLLIIRGEQLIELKPNKHSIGGYKNEMKIFTDHTLQLQKDDSLYLFTDGYADQFGGEKGKKFKYRHVKELLLSLRKRSMEEQKSAFHQTIENWRGNNEQVDDILVMGVKVA